MIQTLKMTQEIFFAVNDFDSFPVLLLEYEYSKTPYYDYYVGIKNDDEAKTFLKKYIEKLERTNENIQLLDSIRHYNIKNQKKRLHVITHDLEHDYKTTLNEIVIPYLRVIDPSFQMDVSQSKHADLPEIVRKAREVFKKDQDSLIQPLPFLTHNYMETVLENLLNTAEARKHMDISYQAYFPARQKYLIRNLTDDRFNHQYIKNTKFVFYGGSYHTHSHACDNAELKDTEGVYFSCVYPNTKDKVFSIMLWNPFYRFKTMLGAKRENYYQNAFKYWDKIDAYHLALEKGKITGDGFYDFNDGPKEGGLAYPLIQAAAKHNYKPIRVLNIQWDPLSDFLIQNKIYEDPKEIKKWMWDEWDAIIFIDKSDLSTTRKLPSN